MEDLNNIWNADDELNDEQLMNYVKGKLTEEDANAVERKIAGSSFMNDAVEGLQQFSGSETINDYTQQVNAYLHKRLINKNSKVRKGIQNVSWEIIVVVAVVLLCILGFAIIELMRK